jgi:hypothetical protein
MNAAEQAFAKVKAKDRFLFCELILKKLGLKKIEVLA